jgi:phosphate transport system permease protein
VTEQLLDAGNGGGAQAVEAQTPVAFGPKRARSKPARSFRTPLWHRVAEKTIAVLALTAIAAIALIFIFITREAIPMFWESDFAQEVELPDLFFAKQWHGYDEPVYVWQPVGEPPKFNVIPLFVGSLKVTLLAMLLSIPLGVGCALFMATYAPRRFREVVKPIIELLAGIPSVVLGFFALIVIASWAQATFNFHFRLNAVVAAVGLALTIVPVIFTISEDALQAVPKTLTEAALALGARKYQVALRVVLPAAIPGIAAGIVLGFGRAIGETMIVLMASGNAAIMEIFDFTTSVRTITATIAAELGEVAQGDPHWRVLFLLGVMLFVATFVLNLMGDMIIERLHRRLTASS